VIGVIPFTGENFVINGWVVALMLLSLSAQTEKTMPEEVFLMFIASSISLWLIQLATGWIDRRGENRRIQRGTVMERHRGHLILIKARIKNRTRMFGEQAFTFNSMKVP
jgi:hypothetical protein